MEKFFPITGSVNVPIPAYMRDHRLGDQAVLPAVEALRILSDTVLNHRPQTNVAHMSDIVFSRLLPIRPGKTTLKLFVEIWTPPDGDGIAAALFTRFTSKSGTLTRMKEHVSAVFPTTPDVPSVPPIDTQHFTDSACFTITTGRLYQELVPFGPGFQSLIGDVRLSPTGATGTACTPTISTQSVCGPLGSPFPLDAAFHVACAWGQRYTRMVVYPTAICQRTVFRPTNPGRHYTTHVLPVHTTDDFLSFDIQIESLAGESYEAIRGACMRPIDGISTRPPDWIMDTP